MIQDKVLVTLNNQKKRNRRRHAPMASKNHDVYSVEANRFALMVKINTSVKNVGVVDIALTVRKNTFAKNAMESRFVCIAE